MIENTGTGEQTKRCSRCGETKPVGEFSLNRRRKDGRSWWCKQCCQADYLSRKPAGHQVRPYPKQRNRLSPDAAEKRCARCGEVKPIDGFPRNSRAADGRMTRCRACMGIDRKERSFSRGSLETRRKWERAYYERNRERELQRAKRLYEALRAEVLEAYGNRCACCGESIAEFLSVDHVNGRAGKNRKELNLTGRAFYLWLKRAGFPQGEFRLLCHNCNIARGHYGYCPHERIA